MSKDHLFPGDSILTVEEVKMLNGVFDEAAEKVEMSKGGSDQTKEKVKTRGGVPKPDAHRDNQMLLTFSNNHRKP